MLTVEQQRIYREIIGSLKPPEEKFPDVCCRECKFSSWDVQRNLFHCACHGIFVTGEDSCDEAESLTLN